MKRKFLAALISIIMAASLAFSFTACVDGGNEPTPDDGGTGQSDPDDEQGDTEGEHTHTFADTWTFDAQNHWHESDCGHDEISDLSRHDAEDGACTVCGAILAGTEGLGYELSPDGTHYTVSDADSAQGPEVVVPSVYNGLPVTDIGAEAFSFCIFLTKITIPVGIAYIGDSAFSDCSSLKQIVIADSVISIGDYAFARCSSLESVTLPEDEKNDAAEDGEEDESSDDTSAPRAFIGAGAFIGCESLESVTLPDGITSIGESAFALCSSLADVIIPDGVVRIGGGAFYWCSSLEYIALPDSIISVGDSAFYGCDLLETVYYSGTAEDWEATDIGDGCADLEDADMVFGCAARREN